MNIKKINKILKDYDDFRFEVVSTFNKLEKLRYFEKNELSRTSLNICPYQIRLSHVFNITVSDGTVWINSNYIEQFGVESCDCELARYTDKLDVKYISNKKYIKKLNKACEKIIPALDRLKKISILIDAKKEKLKRLREASFVLTDPNIKKLIKSESSLTRVEIDKMLEESREIKENNSWESS